MRIFSVAFFRNNNSPYAQPQAGPEGYKFHSNYLRSVVRNHWAVWPDWKLVLHHDDRAREFPYWPCIERMADRGLLSLVYMGEAKKLCEAMLWRMLPCWNLDAEYVLCRDLDSLSTPRERRAIEKWIASGKAVSSLHDSESHSSSELFGGLCGFRTDWVREHWDSYMHFMNRAKENHIDLTHQGSDMHFLNAEVLPFALMEGQVVTEDRASLGPKDHPIDLQGTHLGGAMHVQPYIDWLKVNRHYCKRLDEIEECEK